jgi:polysaccharide export outer membrane protein
MKQLAVSSLVLALLACSSTPNVRPTDDKSTFPAPAGSDPQDDAEALKILQDYADQLAKGYPLYPGDHVRFSVLGNPDLSFSTRVPTEGGINFPLIGKVQLVGRTTEQIREDLTRRLGQDYLVSPDVTVLLDDVAKKYVYVLGAVKEPKQYELPNGQTITLLQSVALAGGFLENGEKHQVLIFRRRSPTSNERLTLPINAINLTLGSKASDPQIIPDDVVFVPYREGVYVLGQVNRPGSFTLQADHPVTVSQAIALAGGLTRLSAENSVRLIRKQSDGKRKSYTVNVARVLSGHPEDDVVLQPGDTVFVPESIF